MQKPIRLQQPNFRIPYFAPQNAAPCTVSPRALAPFTHTVQHHLGRHK